MLNGAQLRSHDFQKEAGELGGWLCVPLVMPVRKVPMSSARTAFSRKLDPHKRRTPEESES